MRDDATSACVQLAGCEPNVIAEAAKMGFSQILVSDYNLKGIPAFALLRKGLPPTLSSGAQPASQLLAWLRSQ